MMEIKKIRQQAVYLMSVCLLGSLIAEVPLTVRASQYHSVSGSDTDVVTVTEDVSYMVYQAGGWGTFRQEQETLIAPYALTQRDKLKTAILKALQESADTLNVRDYGLTTEDWQEIRLLFAEVLNEAPELFYVYSSIGYRGYSTGEITGLTFYYKDTTEEQKRAYAQKLEQVAALVTPEMTDVEKALVLHDYLAQHCAYAYTEYLDDTLYDSPNVFDAYGVLVNGKAVCQGYALAYQAVLQKAGIHASVCTSSSMNHAWNVILIDDNWYHVDVTWDDPVWNKEGQVRHEYFLLSDKEMENREHQGWVDNVDCSSDIYDEYWWKDVDSHIVLIGHNYIYLEGCNNWGFRLVEKTNETVTEKYVNNSRWEVWGENNRYYLGAYSYLSARGDYLLFNDKLNIYAMKPTDTEPQIVYTYEGGDGYLYGAMVYENGTARVNIATSPNRNNDNYITVDLKEKITIHGTVSGRVSCSGSSGEGLMIQLLDEDRNIIAETTADNAGYALENVMEGSYTLRISRENYVPREYTVTVDSQRINVDGELWLTGDVDGSGSINAKDKKMLFEHMSGTPLTGYAFLVGDVDNSGSINAKDKKMLFNHMEGTEKLW